MNVNPEENVIVFECEHQGKLERFIGTAATRADDCVRQVWAKLAAEHGLRPETTKSIYSEWEPSAEDRAFLDANFPAEVKVFHSFPRPEADGWDEAMRQATEQIQQALARRNAERNAEEELSKPNTNLDDLLPVLRMADEFSVMVVNRPVGPGLSFYLAHVNLTPRHTIGMNYVMNHDVESLGKSAGELMGIACGNLVKSLQIQEGQIEGEQVFQVTHPLDMGASAIGLPDFHQNASRWVGTEELFAGFPDPGTLYVTALSNTKAIGQLREAILASDYWGSVALTPACYRLTAAGLELIAARPAPTE